jgi:hypothetical protein
MLKMFQAFQTTSSGRAPSDDFADDVNLALVPLKNKHADTVFQYDELWGPMRGAALQSPEDESDNPFGHDSFRPSVRPAATSSIIDPFADPLTPHDHFLQEFDREFEPVQGSAPAIVVPDLDDEGEDIGDSRLGRERILSAGSSTWSFKGDDEGEDLPPTISPTFEEIDQFGKMSLGPPVPTTGDTSRDSKPPVVIPDVVPEHTISNIASSPITIPTRQLSRDVTSPTSSPTNSAGPRRPSQDLAISPPDSSLIAATTEANPLGPGVNINDTHMTPGGMLEKEVNGEIVTVPADEIVRGVEERRRGSADV